MSLWTRTPIFRIRRGPLLITTLAAHLAARAFEETHFVTDDLGASIAEALAWPFAKVTRDLQQWPADGLRHVWALGKLVACSVQDRPFVQFDGDVLLFRPLPASLCRARLIAQSPDSQHCYTSPDMRGALAVAGFREGATAYNAGIIGGADLALVRDYAHASLALAEKFRTSALHGTLISMLVEQYHLGVFAARAGVEVGTLLPTMPTKRQMTLAGYAHLTGSAKHSTTWIARAEARLARDFPEAYARFCEAWPHLAPHR